jgi:CheY-like chemotaxis protein
MAMRVNRSSVLPTIRPEGTVLIVDDDPDQRNLMRMRLERMRYRVFEATTGEEAVARASAAPFDLCLLDIRMPGMDGIDAFAQLRDVAPDMRVVFVTGTTDDDTFERAVNADSQPDGYLNKPVSSDAIARCVDVVLNKGGRYLSVA